MSLDLNKLENKLDEALSNETSETLTKFLNDKRMENNKQQMTRLIEHKGVWCKIGDLIQIKEKRSFLFWYLPFSKTVTYQIDFIGLDCSALLKNPKTKEVRTITGNVNVL
jgi:hypothetical protein